MRIAIMGTPVSSGNRGVLALGTSLVNLCLGTGNEVEVSLMLNHQNNEPTTFRVCGRSVKVRVVNCRLSPRSKFCDHLAWIVLSALVYHIMPLPYLRRTICRCTPWIDELEKADWVGDVRGGDSFSDIYGIWRFLNGFFMAWTVLLVKGTMVQFPQTYGPYKIQLSYVLSRFLLRRSSVVIARDEASRQAAQAQVGRDREVWLSPDVAFSMEAVLPEKIKFYPPLQGAFPKNVIGLNVNGLMFNEGYSRKNMFNLKLNYRELLPKLVEALINETEADLWLVPHTYGTPESVESDPEACRRVKEELTPVTKKRVRIVTGEYDQHELKGVIGHCDFFIGSRMHACIAALSQGVPCVGIAYSKKFEGVFDSVGMQGWVVDGRNATCEQAVASILELYRKRDTVRISLVNSTAKAKNKLENIFKCLTQMRL